MQARITYAATGVCTWCEKEGEGVQTAFSSEFFPAGSHLCTRCLFKALRVDAMKAGDAKPTSKPRAA